MANSKKYTYRKCSKVETVIIEDGRFETDSLSSKIAFKKTLGESFNFTNLNTSVFHLGLLSSTFASGNIVIAAANIVTTLN